MNDKMIDHFYGMITKDHPFLRERPHSLDLETFTLTTHFKPKSGHTTGPPACQTLPSLCQTLICSHVL